MPVDLHSHSTASDGSFSPSDLARAFDANGIRIAALTDHDTVGGVAEFTETCAGLGITVVPGIEFSTIFRGQEVHLLGYGMNFDDPRWQRFIGKHHAYLRDRCAGTVAKLQGLGFDLTLEQVYEISSGNPPMPPHIIRALAKNGRIADLAAAVNFFNDYLSFGAKAWVDHETKLASPLGMLVEIGAVAIVAHPQRLYELGWLEDILDLGAHGFELYYPGQEGKLFDELQSIAIKRDCMVTGGCDYHGAFTPRVMREIDVPLEVGIRLLEAVGMDIPATLASEGGGPS